MNPSLSEFLTHDHQHCDATWAAVEAQDDDLPATWEQFRHELLRHLDFEEQVLFPAFEQISGMRGGPVDVMRMEHNRMRALVGQMEDELAAGNPEGLLDQGDTLMMLIQQHNMKEEGVLYPMMSRALADDWPVLFARFPQ